MELTTAKTIPLKLLWNQAPQSLDSLCKKGYINLGMRTGPIV